MQMELRLNMAPDKIFHVGTTDSVCAITDSICDLLFLQAKSEETVRSVVAPSET